MTALLKIMALLPLPILHLLGIVLGWLIYLAPGRLPLRLRGNLTQSGVCQDAAACRHLLRKVIAETGKGVMELPAIWLRPYKNVLELVRETRGWEKIDAARAAGHGVILIGPHIGCFEIINLYYAARHPFTVMYKPPRQAALQTLMLAGRQRGKVNLVPTDLSGVRGLLAALKRGEAVGVLPDHVASRGDGVWAPFFGRPAYTPTLVASLQRKTGAATLINRGVEDMVRRFPAQYLWSYNGYKRPGGVSKPGDPA